MKKYIICFSGGESSARVAIEAVRRHGKENVILLNHNIHPGKEARQIKDFKRKIAAYLGLPITFANYQNVEAEDQIPDQFEISLMVGGFKQPSTGNAFCTYYLKTLPFMLYLAENFPLGPDKRNHDCVICYGFDDNEQARINRRSGILTGAGYDSEFPLAQWPTTIETTAEIGIPKPSTYSVYKHGNCKGCLKGGIQHWYVTYCNEPEVWVQARETETKMLIKTGKAYSILKDQRFKPVKPLYLSSLESVFEAMKKDGVPQTEHYPRGKFKNDLKKYRLAEDEVNAAPLIEDQGPISCECFTVDPEDEDE
jgi:hypothetical protein